MESGACCPSPALRNRRFCYSHLRLRGERIRMARAIAHRQPYRLMLPALDDIAGVRVAAARVADALAAGVLEPQRAGRLVYTFQQISSALRWEAKARLNPTREETGAPPLSPVGDRVGDDQKLLVEEYPEFEAEFGLPAGLDLSQPPHVLFRLLSKPGPQRPPLLGLPPRFRPTTILRPRVIAGPGKALSWRTWTNAASI